MGTLDLSACKELFSVSYVEALAYTAGYAVHVIHVDHFGVDLEIRDRAMRIDVQMKCMNESKSNKKLISYSLDARTYNLLSDPDRNVPAYLFVLEVPHIQREWVDSHPTGISLKRCGYFSEMTALKPTNNQSSKVVKISRNNRLTVQSLEDIMKSARGGL